MFYPNIVKSFIIFVTREIVIKWHDYVYVENLLSMVTTVVSKFNNIDISVTGTRIGVECRITSVNNIHSGDTSLVFMHHKMVVIKCSDQLVTMCIQGFEISLVWFYIRSEVFQFYNNMFDLEFFIGHGNVVSFNIILYVLNKGIFIELLSIINCCGRFLFDIFLVGLSNIFIDVC